MQDGHEATDRDTPAFEHDADALRLASQGDAGALAHLYDSHAGAMLRVASRFLAREEDAEDLVHDVFLEAWQRADSYDRQRASVRAWLLVRVRSRCLDRLRFSKLQAAKAVTLLASQAGMDETTPSDAAEHGRVAKALTVLSAPQRQVLELAYFRGMTCREIASRCELAEGTVKTRLAAALKRMRLTLAETSG